MSDPRMFRILLDAAPTAILVAREGRVVYANPAAAQLVAAESPTALIGTPVFDVFHPGDHDFIERRLRLGQERQRLPEVAERIVKRDGSIRDVDVDAIPFTDDEGPAVQYTFRTLSENRAAETALRERNEYIEAILENAPIGFAVNTIDDGVGRYVSRRFEALYHVPEGSIRTVGEYFDAVFRDPAFREEIRTRIMTDMASGDPARMRWESLPLLLESGEVRYVTAINIPLIERNMMVSTVQDVTERTRAEIAVRENAALLQAAVTAGTIGLWSWNPATGAAWFSREWKQQIGFAEDELPSTLEALSERLHPDDRDSVLAAIGDAADEASDLHVEFRLRHKDGSYRWIASHASAHRDARESATRLVGAHLDLTDRKQLEDQLRQSQKMEAIGRPAGGVAHDFNNMLSVIIGNADMALREAEARGEDREDLIEIMSAARRSADLTRQLLAFARQQTINPLVLDLDHAIGGMLRMLQRLIGEDVRLAWTPGSGGWHVTMDPTQLDQIMMNLVVNARDAMEGAGTLTIRTAQAVVDEAHEEVSAELPPGPYVQVTVSDTGRGMTPDVLARVFEPFFSTKGRGKGTGLGLSTVYGIVRQNAGFLKAYSEPGAGTTMKVWLPRSEGCDASDAPSASEAVSGGDETVLIVDDVPQVVKVGESMLASLGYTVLTAGSPGEAITTTQRHPDTIHLVVTDVIMPEMTGRELSARLCAERPGLKTLFMSGYTADVIGKHGVLEKGVHFLPKPFSMAAMARAVRAALDS